MRSKHGTRPRVVLTKEERAADAALAACIVLAPALGGSSNIVALPILAAGAIAATVATYLAAKRTGSSLHVTPLVGALFVLALFTLFQALPLPQGLLGLLSPRAQEVRAMVDADSWGSLSYESSATWREVAKLLLY